MVYEIGGPEQAQAASAFVEMLAGKVIDKPIVTKLENGRTQVIVPGHVDAQTYFAFSRLIQPRSDEDTPFGSLGRYSHVLHSPSPREASELTKTVAATRLQFKSFVDRLFGAKPSPLPPGYKEADFVPSSLY